MREPVQYEEPDLLVASGLTLAADPGGPLGGYLTNGWAQGHGPRSVPFPLSELSL